MPISQFKIALFNVIRAVLKFLTSKAVGCWLWSVSEKRIIIRKYRYLEIIILINIFLHVWNFIKTPLSSYRQTVSALSNFRNHKNSKNIYSPLNFESKQKHGHIIDEAIKNINIIKNISTIALYYYYTILMKLALWVNS